DYIQAVLDGPAQVVALNQATAAMAPPTPPPRPPPAPGAPGPAGGGGGLFCFWGIVGAEIAIPNLYL
ncbi:hypothetical protein ACUNGQ_22075, partial [Serratia sp. IR-2025]